MKDLYIAPGDRDVTLSDLFVRMRSVQVSRLLVKELSPNDNSKNQPYFGSDFSVLNVIPTGKIEALPSTSGKPTKRNRSILRASLDLSWMDRHGQLYAAPHSKLILYPQYPEVRLSGFLREAAAGPSSLMNSQRLGRTTGRLLFLGVRSDGKLIGYMASADSQIARAFRNFGTARQVGVFTELIFGTGNLWTDGRERLLRALARIHQKGWIQAKHLHSDGRILPCTGPRCVGHTLEAELGISPNARTAPDFEAWEIKALTVEAFERAGAKPVTLMTPEPSGGFYARIGAAAFVRRFGLPGAQGSGKLHFTGRHTVGRNCVKTGLTLQLLGYDPTTNKILNPSEGLALVTKDGEVAALWHYAKLIDHWKRKHDLAAYIPAVKRQAEISEFWYGNRIKLGIGTDFFLLLKALTTGAVYFDPGTSLGERIHARSQFRIVLAGIAQLYRSAEDVDLLQLEAVA